MRIGAQVRRLNEHFTANGDAYNLVMTGACSFKRATNTWDSVACIIVGRASIAEN